jgi:transposase InsO family protein
LRFVLLCEALESTREDLAFTAFERLFAERGLPSAIRSDNGVPLFNLSKLSVWRLRLGMQIERIKPGHPQQNGRHERMHLTLKKEATRPPGANSLQQQAKFDNFVREFNGERPHEALGMKCPAEICIPSPLGKFVRRGAFRFFGVAASPMAAMCQLVTSHLSRCLFQCTAP